MNKTQILECLKAENSSDLFREADQVRLEYCGNEVYIRGILEFSNYCCQDCFYCGLRCSNEKAIRYRMNPEDIIASAKRAVELKIPTVVLQSGEDSFYKIEDLCFIVQELKKLNIAITLSVGERSLEDYQKLKDAGADRYLLRFETSDEKLYARLRPGRYFVQRLKCLEQLKDLGYQVGSGIMVGLPGQSFESIANDILLFRSLDLDMIGIGPFLPHPNTPLSGDLNIGIETVLKVLALARIVTKNTHIPATTAVGTLDAQGRQKALRCGANVIMPNITPTQYRKLYEIYPDKICVNEDALKCRACVEAMAIGAGRTIATGFGHTLKRNF
jgi:biotin synthase